MAVAKVIGQTTDPGTSSALTVLIAMGVLFLIVSGLWERVGAFWMTLNAPPPKQTFSTGVPFWCKIVPSAVGCPSP